MSLLSPIARLPQIVSLLLGFGSVLVACDDAARTVALRSEAAPTSSVDAQFFRNAALRRAIGVLRGKLGEPVNALQLEIFTDRVVVQAQDPVHPSRVEQFVLRGSAIATRKPVRLEGPGALEQNLFPLSEVPLDAIETMVSVAIARVAPERGKPTRLVARRDLPRDRDVRVRIYVESPGFDDHVDFDSTGKAIDEPAKSQ